MRHLILAAGLLATTLAAAPQPSPWFTSDGKLNYPQHYREWVFLSSGLDMSYDAAAATGSHSTFDNVFAEPGAYREFVRTGTWPDHTLLVMESREGVQQGSINRQGRFQTLLNGLEVHVKDQDRFAGGWGFFAFDDQAASTMIPAAATCYECHRAHGAVDTTFVQFYPTLLDIAKRRGTLRAP
jgi:hypothetical protein